MRFIPAANRPPDGTASPLQCRNLQKRKILLTAIPAPTDPVLASQNKKGRKACFRM
jgi:hypothetical protein